LFPEQILKKRLKSVDLGAKFAAPPFHSPPLSTEPRLSANFPQMYPLHGFGIR
jgi:hypothetical protein